MGSLSTGNFGKVLFLPKFLYRRWKYRNTQPPLRAMLELHDYSDGIVNFLGATVMNPHILHEADIDENSRVIDVGAYIGKWSRNIAERYNPEIFAFEPNPQSFEKMKMELEDYPRVKLYEYGLGAAQEVVEFTLKGLGSSMYDEREENADVSRIEVRIEAIDEVWRALEMGRVDLMKINIEGAEFPLLQRMIETDLLESVDTYLIQFHDWHPGAHTKRERIRAELAKTHREEWNYEFVWEKWVRK